MPVTVLSLKGGKSPKKGAAKPASPPKAEPKETSAAAPTAEGGMPAWMQRGRTAAHRLEQERAATEARKAKTGGYFRFWLNPGEKAHITFLDGNFDSDGMFDQPHWYEHEVKEGPKRFSQYVCTRDVEPCPICEAGDRPTYVAGFAIIDHRRIKGRQNKVYENEPKLLVAKPQSLEMLREMGKKRGGLKGWRVEVTRTKGDRAPKIGDVWDWEEKVDVSKFKSSDGKRIEFDWDKAVPFVSAEQLRALGVGRDTASVGSVAASATGDEGEGVDPDADL